MIRIGHTTDKPFSGLGAGKSVRFLNGKWNKISHLNLVRGTLLFGEFVKEICTYHAGYQGFETRYSLHVIDAIRLGDMDLRSYTYLERCLPSTSQPHWFTDFDCVFRFKFIEMYCKSVSRESESGYSVRVRPKPIYSLTEIVIPDNGLTNLPLQGYKATSEQFAVQSILMFNSMEKTFSK